MEKGKVLIISTEHIKPETSAFLHRNTEKFFTEMFRFSLHEFGIIFFIRDLDKDEREEMQLFLNRKDMLDLLPIFEHAMKKGYSLINFDRDGMTTKKFPTYTWG